MSPACWRQDRAPAGSASARCVRAASSRQRTLIQDVAALSAGRATWNVAIWRRASASSPRCAAILAATTDRAAATGPGS